MSDLAPAVPVPESVPPVAAAPDPPVAAFPEWPAPQATTPAPFAPGTIVAHDGRYGIVLAHHAGELVDTYDVALLADVRVGLRPEALEVA